MAKRYQATHHDENDEAYVTLHTTRRKAEREANDDPQCVQAITTTTATALLRQRLNGHRVTDDNALDLAACELVDQGIIRADGVFWNDRYDPLSLSSPRAVIVPTRIPAWITSARTAR